VTTSAVLTDMQPGQVVQTELTLEEFLALEPDTYEPPYLEYEGEGLVRRKMSPNPKHSELQPYLAHLLLSFSAQSGQRLHVYTELRTTTGGRSRLPDVAVYVDRRPRESARQQAIDIADVSIEILSPDDSRLQLRAKCRWYLEQGSRAALLLNPEAEIAEYFGPAEAWETYEGARSLALDDILPGLDLTPQTIFAILHQP
jgi:Uma2 family endonuclease